MTLSPSEASGSPWQAGGGRQWPADKVLGLHVGAAVQQPRHLSHVARLGSSTKRIPQLFSRSSHCHGDRCAVPCWLQCLSVSCCTSILSCWQTCASQSHKTRHRRRHCHQPHAVTHRARPHSPQSMNRRPASSCVGQIYPSLRFAGGQAGRAERGAAVRGRQFSCRLFVQRPTEKDSSAKSTAVAYKPVRVAPSRNATITMAVLGKQGRKTITCHGRAYCQAVTDRG